MSPVTPDELSQSELFIVKQVQRECFPKEVSALMEGRELHRTSSIISLSPIFDSSGIMRVGGRLRYSKGAKYLEVHPVIIPKGSHIADLLIRHYHAIAIIREATSLKESFEWPVTGSLVVRER